MAAPPETTMRIRPIEVGGVSLAGGAVPVICTPLVGRTQDDVLAELAATFAVGKASSAPGQIPIEELRAVLATVRRATGI